MPLELQLVQQGKDAFIAAQETFKDIKIKLCFCCAMGYLLTNNKDKNKTPVEELNKNLYIALINSNSKVDFFIYTAMEIT